MIVTIALEGLENILKIGEAAQATGGQNQMAILKTCSSTPTPTFTKSQSRCSKGMWRRPWLGTNLAFGMTGGNGQQQQPGTFDVS
jgi:hypothetical protein